MSYVSLIGPINLRPANGAIEIYYPETNQWDYDVPSLTPPRYLYGYASYQNKAYYAGGMASGLVSTISILEYNNHCLPEGITFSTQAEIDNFQTNYPGCTEIEGDVVI